MFHIHKKTRFIKSQLNARDTPGHQTNSQKYQSHFRHIFQRKNHAH